MVYQKNKKAKSGPRAGGRRRIYVNDNFTNILFRVTNLFKNLLFTFSIFKRV